MGRTETGRVVVLPATLTVRQLADAMNVSPIDVIKELMNNGIMANINQQIDYETAAIVASEMGFETQEEAPPVVEEVVEEGPAPLWQRLYAREDPSNLRPRPPVVTISGPCGPRQDLAVGRHPPQQRRQAGEVGGITQHMWRLPGARGTQSHHLLWTLPATRPSPPCAPAGRSVTDIAVLVVAADDGIMPQTIEAINHARAAGVPIIVALNKIDLPTANPDHG
jgi:translation initiation factor IF-2